MLGILCLSEDSCRPASGLKRGVAFPEFRKLQEISVSLGASQLNPVYGRCT